MKGKIIKCVKNRYSVLTRKNELYYCKLKVTDKINKGQFSNPIAVGDFVEFSTIENEKEGTIHKVLQRLHRPNGEISKNRILRILNEEWKNDEFDYSVREEKFKEQGIEILSEYISFVKDNTPNVLNREKPFEFNIGHVSIKGVIDRIDKVSDGIEIVDYKTSRTTSPAKSNLQLAIYSMYL